MNISETLIVFIISEIIILLSIVWKAASVYGELKSTIQKNAEDISQIAKLLRRNDKLSWQRMNKMEEFLQSKGGYNPVSLSLFDDD